MTHRMLIVLAVGLGAAGAAEPLSVQPREVPPAERDPALPPGAIRTFGDTRFRHPGGVTSSALSPDGKRLATAATRSVVLWDTTTGEAVGRFEADGGSRRVNPGLAFTPDGARLAAVLTATDLFVWDVATGAEVKRLNDERSGKAEFNGLLTFAAGGRELVVGRADTTEFFDARTWKVAQSISTAARLVSPVGPTLIGHAGANGDVFLADLSQNGAAVGLKAQTRAGGLALSPDGRTLATFSLFGRLELWSVPDGRPLQAAEVMGDVRYGEVTFAADGNKLFLATRSDLSCRDVSSLKVISTLPSPASGHFTGAHLLSDGETLLACASDGLIRRFHWRTGKALPGPAGYTSALAAAVTADARQLVVGDHSGRVDVWDTTTGERIATLSASGDPVARVAVAADGRAVAVGRVGPGLVEVLDVVAGKELGRFRLPGSEREARHAHVLAFSPDGRVLVAATWWGRLQAWDRSAATARWSGDQATVCGFCPDGKSMVCSSRSGTLVFVDPVEGAEGRRVELAEERRSRGIHEVRAVAFSPDGRRLAVATGDGRVRLCDPATGAERAAFPVIDPPPSAAMDPRTRVSSGAESLAFSPDGRWILAGGLDGSTRLWEVDTHQEARRFAGHEWRVSLVAFGPGGTALSAGGDGAIYQWDLRPAAPAGGRPAWDDLAADAATGYRAVWAILADPPEAVRLLRAKLPAAAVPKPDELARLIGRLDSDEFAVRESAARALADLGPLAASALRAALAGKPTAEARERITKVLDRLATEPSPAERRAIRAALVLERIGTDEARVLLAEWAAGAPAARLTEEAKASLARLRAK